jgi:hypothetical protein
MIEKYLSIKKFSSGEYPEIADLVLNAREHLNIERLFNKTLKKLQQRFCKMSKISLGQITGQYFIP